MTFTHIITSSQETTDLFYSVLSC